jgi:acetylornithine deacetylase
MSLQLIDEILVGDQQLSRLVDDALMLLKQLIATPSFSGEEDNTADWIQAFMENRDMNTRRLRNNIWAFNKYYDPQKPTILLNSHHDTVKPNEGYTRDPYLPEVRDGKLYGLGSNDAGGCLVSLLAIFRYFYNSPNLCYNLCFAATAEEENTGENGLKAVLPLLGHIDFAIVGEPTKCNWQLPKWVVWYWIVPPTAQQATPPETKVIMPCIKQWQTFNGSARFIFRSVLGLWEI